LRDSLDWSTCPEPNPEARALLYPCGHINTEETLKVKGEIELLSLPLSLSLWNFYQVNNKNM
jgi:hypothetical protein